MSDFELHGSRTLSTGKRAATALWAILLLLAAVPFSFAQASETPTTGDDRYYEPLPQETGTAGLKLMLRRLQTTGRLMQVTAHPDDEDGGMLTLESRGKGVSTLLMTLTRGEGGQNKLGSNLFDVLGVLRTLELLASDRYYGVEQRFSRVADFGYSKTPEETFQKWQGHDVALADLVRVIRTFRPDVLVARFSGTDRDGHGHHQASAILTKEAFRAAADPKRFPEQIAEGLQPWQAKKLYSGNVCGFFSSTCDAANYSVRINTGVKDPVLGTSYIQFAMKGLRHQQSQGTANWTIDDGDRFTHYKLLDSVVESPKDKDGHEQDLFAGIDTSLPGLASGLGEEEKKAPWLRAGLAEIKTKLEEAAAAAEKNPASAEPFLAAAAGMVPKLFNQIAGSGVSAEAKTYLRVHLLESLSADIEKARALANGANLHVVVDAPAGANPEDAFMAVPGQSFEVTATFTASNSAVRTTDLSLQLPHGWTSTVLGREHSPHDVSRFKITAPLDAAITRPYWHRNDPETEALNIIDDPQYRGRPFPPPPVKGVAALGKSGVISSVCVVRYKDSAGNIKERPLAVAPAFAVTVQPSTAVVPSHQNARTTVEVSARNQGNDTNADVALKVSDGWRSDPRDVQSTIAKGQSKDAAFEVFPSVSNEGRKDIHAELRSNNHVYSEGYSIVTRDDLGTGYYYQPAVQRVSIVDVNVPKNLRLGYIMGAGDEIPTVLRQIGMNVTLIPSDKLTNEDLSKYQTIVLGIRAYDNEKAVIANNKKLLAFVEAGGRLVVQYNASASDFNDGKFTPYPMTLSRARVSAEQAPIAMLDPANPIFHSPNEITQKDFEGWVQERGLYFASQWDPKFTPLLETHDPGEGEQKGGLLVAQYGKGKYIYTGLAFFRQLPAGIPGAVRLFVNVVSGE
ncbi:MAG: PIG-L family deacetylase [Acidobacteria bacterium]|nr:PIG-L family deacetylase [Acidobacteriota bacterium]